MEPAIHFLYFRICYEGSRPDSTVLVGTKDGNDIIWIFKRMFDSGTLNNDVEVVVINGSLWTLMEIYELLSEGKNIGKEILNKLYNNPFLLTGVEDFILTDKPSFDKATSYNVLDNLKFDEEKVSRNTRRVFRNIMREREKPSEGYIVAMLDGRDSEKSGAAIEVKSSKEIMFAARDLVSNVLTAKDYIKICEGKELGVFVVVWEKEHEGDEVQLINSRSFRMLLEDLNDTVFLDGELIKILYLLAKTLKKFGESLDYRFKSLYEYTNFMLDVLVVTRLVSLEDYFEFIGSLMALFAGLEIEEEDVDELKELIVMLLSITSSVSGLLEKESRMKNLCILM